MQLKLVISYEIEFVKDKKKTHHERQEKNVISFNEIIIKSIQTREVSIQIPFEKEIYSLPRIFFSSYRKYIEPDDLSSAHISMNKTRKGQKDFGITWIFIAFLFFSSWLPMNRRRRKETLNQTHREQRKNRDVRRSSTIHTLGCVSLLLQILFPRHLRLLCISTTHLSHTLSLYFTKNERRESRRKKMWKFGTVYINFPSLYRLNCRTSPVILL